MLKVKCQGLEAIISEGDLVELLNQSKLPWYITNRNGIELEVFVLGNERDITITGEPL